MDSQSFLSGIEWFHLVKSVGLWVLYFIFYTVLIQTTISVFSDMLVASEENKKERNNIIAACSILWAMFIMFHTHN